MGQPVVDMQLTPESPLDIKRSCKDDILYYPDPTLHLQLQLQLAIANDDFASAVQCAQGPFGQVLGLSPQCPAFRGEIRTVWAVGEGPAQVLTI